MESGKDNSPDLQKEDNQQKMRDSILEEFEAVMGEAALELNPSIQDFSSSDKRRWSLMSAE